jgi:predicted ester cyclase
MHDPAERNKDVIRRLLAEVDRGNLDVVDTCYAPGYVDHTPSPLRSLASGREGVRQAFALFYRAFPDTKHTIEDLVAEGDRVAARISARGTHTGELFGHAPTGRVVTQTSISIYRIGAGQIQERWAEQGGGVLDQLGIATPPAAPASTIAPKAERSR